MNRMNPLRFFFNLIAKLSLSSPPAPTAIPSPNTARAIPSPLTAGEIPSPLTAGAIPSSNTAGAIPTSIAAGSVPSFAITAGSIPSLVITGGVSHSISAPVGLIWFNSGYYAIPSHHTSDAIQNYKMWFNGYSYTLADAVSHPARFDASAAMQIYKRSYSKGPPPPPRTVCIWCKSPLGCGGCQINYCSQLPFDTLRRAVDYLASENRYGCVIDQKRFNGTEGLEEHYRNHHKEVVKHGTKCRCGAFFLTAADMSLHLTRRDEFRCAYKPNENSKQRKDRIKKQMWRAKKASFELRKYGY